MVLAIAGGVFTLVWLYMIAEEAINGGGKPPYRGRGRE
jgi:hypothetical protein